jgi:hypothetical protein
VTQTTRHSPLDVAANGSFQTIAFQIVPSTTAANADCLRPGEPTMRSRDVADRGGIPIS